MHACPRRRARALALAAAVAAAVAGCGATAQESGRHRTVTLFAAASLARVMHDEIALFERRHPEVTVDGDYEGSQALVAKLEADPAVADVFISADQRRMTEAQRHGLVAAPSVIARNRLVIIVPADDPAHITSLADLGRPGVRVVVADPAVPAGGFAQQLFAAAATAGDVPAGFSSAVAANTVSREDNVEGVVAKVSTGVADAGIVYATDALAVRTVHAVAPPARDDPVSVYPAAVTSHARAAQAAREFLDLLLGSAGRALLRSAGFDVPG